jgi:hypothetical protein
VLDFEVAAAGLHMSKAHSQRSSECNNNNNSSNNNNNNHHHHHHHYHHHNNNNNNDNNNDDDDNNNNNNSNTSHILYPCDVRVWHWLCTPSLTAPLVAATAAKVGHVSIGWVFAGFLGLHLRADSKPPSEGTVAGLPPPKLSQSLAASWHSSSDTRVREKARSSRHRRPRTPACA